MKRSSPRLPKDREDELAALAEEVGSAQRLPIDPLSLLQAQGVTSNFNHYAAPFDGLLEWRNQSFHVYCNLTRVETKGSPRARFTLAHELGHYFIDEHRNALISGAAPSHPSVCDYQSPHLVEKEADFFASALLMPKPRFATAARRAAKGLHGVLELAAQFGTSVTATALRYLQCHDSEPCAVVRWDPDGYAWKRLSTAAYVQGYRRTIEDPARLLRDSPTSRVLRGETGVLEAGTTASAWFPFVNVGSEKNAILRENAVSLGRFGALTFLSLA